MIQGMKFLSKVAAVLVFVPLSLEGSDADVSVASADTIASGEFNSLEWLEAYEFSAEKLEAAYGHAVGGGIAGEVGNPIMSKVPHGAESEVMIPVLFLAVEGEGEGRAEEEVENDDRTVESPEEIRIRQLELENAALKERLSRVEPFVDPEWPPAEVKPRKRRVRFRPRGVRPADLERPVRPPLVAVKRYPVRFKPFTRAAMDTPMSGPISRARGQSLKEQSRFFWNVTKALGGGIASKEYRGVRLEVQRAMLRGELNARYAVQYLADVVEIFRMYENMERFRLTDGVAPPVSADSFRGNPDTMFRWASEVNEQKRKLRRESSVER